MRKSISIHSDFYEEIAALDDCKRGQLMLALVNFAQDGEENTPDLPSDCAILYRLMTAQINRISAANSGNGACGGRPKSEKSEAVLEKAKKAKKAEVVSEKRKNPTVTNSVTVPVTVTNPIGEYTLCAEPSACADAPRSNQVITLTLNDKSEYPVYEEQTQEWAALYPAVNVIQQLRNMAGWLIANPSKRKTKAGILRFINSWLSKAQDRGGDTGLLYAGTARGRDAPKTDAWSDLIAKYEQEEGSG